MEKRTKLKILDELIFSPKGNDFEVKRVEKKMKIAWEVSHSDSNNPIA